MTARMEMLVDTLIEDARWDGLDLPALAETAAHAVRRSLVIGVDRSFTQDPRFGFICLSEIGSRALSPGINDPGTAIDVIRRHTRLFSVWAELRTETPVLRHDRLHLPPLDAETLMEDAFLGLERDGASLVEVGIWLQHAYASLAALPDTDIAAAARARSVEADRRSRETLSFEPDKARVAQAAAVVGELRLRS